MNPTEIVFSASSIKTFEKCSWEFYLKKIKKEPETDPSSHYGFFGTAIHNSAFTAFANWSPKLKEWKPFKSSPDYERAWGLYDYIFEQKSGENKEFDSIIKEEGSVFPETFWKKPKQEELNTQDVQTWKEFGNKMLVSAVDELCNHKIKAFEYTLEFELEGKKFIGFIDVLCEDSDGKIYFLDLKTEWKPPSKNEVDKNIQFVLYSAGLKKTLGLDYYPNGYFIHLRTEKKIEFNMTDENRRTVWSKIKNMFKAIENETYTKSTQLKTSLCPYCSYFTHCYGVNYTKDVRKMFYD